EIDHHHRVRRRHRQALPGDAAGRQGGAARGRARPRQLAPAGLRQDGPGRQPGGRGHRVPPPPLAGHPRGGPRRRPGRPPGGDARDLRPAPRHPRGTGGPGDAARAGAIRPPRLPPLPGSRPRALPPHPRRRRSRGADAAAGGSPGGGRWGDRVL
ncbi:MAG: hypothetical protein AVDCRST_MAG68-1626, partial [uncultured Gemmatimonadetes bacterium]